MDWTFPGGIDDVNRVAAVDQLNPSEYVERDGRIMFVTFRWPEQRTEGYARIWTPEFEERNRVNQAANSKAGGARGTAQPKGFGASTEEGRSQSDGGAQSGGNSSAATPTLASVVSSDTVKLTREVASTVQIDKLSLIHI